MANPAPANFQNGVGAVSGDNLNTFPQVVFNLAQLRTFTGVASSVAFVLGAVAPNDGGQSFYFYQSSGSYVDNGTSVIVPYFSLTGAWIQIQFSLNGAAYPTSNPGAGSGLIWNNQGFLCVA
jgi:hypothetical protein